MLDMLFVLKIKHMYTYHSQGGIGTIAPRKIEAQRTIVITDGRTDKTMCRGRFVTKIKFMKIRDKKEKVP